MTDADLHRRDFRPVGPPPATARRRAGSLVGVLLGGALALAPVAAPTGVAETPAGLRPALSADPAAAKPDAGKPDAGADRRAAVRGELEGVLRDIDLGKEREAAIAAEIEALTRDRGRLSEQLVATGARLREAEAKVAVTETRIADLDRDLGHTREALAARRGTLAEVLAALQRIGRNPPPAIAVRPQDALAAVRSAILIGALMPELRDQAEALLADLQSLQGLQAAAASERDRFRAEGADLVAERRRLELLIEERRKSGAEREAGLAEERRRTAALAERAGSLRELVASLEKAHATAAPAPSATSLAVAHGGLPVPVVGDTILGFGQTDAAGLGSKGVSIAAAAGAAVTSPCDGAVIFAGPFRSYGKLLIINGGAGYHVLLAGMERIDVEIGQTVLAGEPVGFMSSTPEPTTGSRSPRDRPILYVEFRKDGMPIDPSPWWGREEKVRG